MYFKDLLNNITTSIKKMPLTFNKWFKKRQKGEGSSTDLRGSRINTIDPYLEKNMLGCYTDLSDDKWYGVLRTLKNQHINIHIDLKVAGHIIEGETHSIEPEGMQIWDEKLQWAPLYSKWYDYEVLCR